MVCDSHPWDWNLFRIFTALIHYHLPPTTLSEGFRRSTVRHHPNYSTTQKSYSVL